MRILVLGASGRVGQWVTKLAAERGHTVTALVRPATPFTSLPGVVAMRGEPTDADALEGALVGQDVVISALGLRRAGKSPWAALCSPPDLTTRVTRLLAPAMRRRGIARLVAVSAAGVGDSFARLSRPVQWLVRSGNVGVAYRDLEAMEAVLDASGLDALAVRPVTLVDGLPTGRARPVERYGLFSIVRRADVAEFMLDAAERRAPLDERRVLLGTSM